MLADVRRSIAHEHMLARHEPLWVAVSGGMDSMVLLHALRSLGHSCHVVHVDHGLRGAESDTDRRFVEEHCRTLSIQVHVESVDVFGRAAERGLSTQMAARELRYEVFHRLLVGDGPRKLALAHHADDAVETLLMNLMRGTGIAGWRGIAPVSGPFVRPLLAVRRSAIAGYATENGIAYREDSSNTDPHYLRNRVRHELVPLMEALRPGSRSVLAREVEQLRGLVTVVERSFGHTLGSVNTGLQNAPVHRWTASGLVPFDVINASGAPILFLQWLLAGKGFHPHIIEAMHDAVGSINTGARFLSDTHTVTVERTGLHIAPSTDQCWPEVLIGADLVIPPEAGVVVNGCAPHEVDYREGTGTAWLDRDRLEFPLLLRQWQPGDRMRPIGSVGSKLISDILTDAKVPNATRAHHRVLVSGGTIVWLLGHRVADGFNVGATTGHVVKLALPD